MFSDEFWFVRTKRKKLQRIFAVFKFLPFLVAKTWVFVKNAKTVTYIPVRKNLGGLEPTLFKDY